MTKAYLKIAKSEFISSTPAKGFPFYDDVDAIEAVQTTLDVNAT